MLRHIDPLLTPELLYVLQAMGHGDDLLACDRNHPAARIAPHTTHGRVIPIAGGDLTALARAILRHVPLDMFVEAPIACMQVVGDPDRLVPAHAAMMKVAEEAEGRPIPLRPLERFAFYEEAENAFAVVQAPDPDPYGCFLLKKGVL